MIASSDDRPIILVIGAGTGQVPFLRALSKEYRLVGTDRNPNAAGRAWLEHFLSVDCSHEEEIIRFAQTCVRNGRISKVLSFTSFEPQRTASNIANRLKVPGPPHELVECALSKSRLSQLLGTLGVSHTSTYLANTPEDALAFLKSKTGTFYLKPDNADSRRSVLAVDSRVCTQHDIASVFTAAKNGAVVIEPEAVGREYKVVLAIRDSRLVFFSVNHAIKLRDCFTVPLGYILGFSRDKSALSLRLMDLAMTLIRRFELHHCTFGFDVIVAAEKTTVIDIDLSNYFPVILARTAGNFSIPDCLIGNAGLTDADNFPTASGFMFALIREEQSSPENKNNIIESLKDKYSSTFVSDESASPVLVSKKGLFFKIGYWLVNASDKANAAEILDDIANDYYNSQIVSDQEHLE